MYMRSRSPANNAASSPPVPALISMIVCARIIGIARNQRGAQFLLNCRKLALQTFRFFREIRIFGSHFLGCLQIVFHLLVCGVCGNDDAQLGVTTSQLTHLIRIRRDFRLGHLLFDIMIFLKCGNCRGELLVCQCTPFSICL